MKSLAEYINESLKNSDWMRIEFEKNYSDKGRSWKSYIEFLHEEYNAKDVTSKELCGKNEYRYLIHFNKDYIFVIHTENLDAPAKTDDLSIIETKTKIDSYMKKYNAL